MGIKYKLTVMVVIVGLLVSIPAAGLFYMFVKDMQYKNALNGRQESLKVTALVIADNMQNNDFIPIMNYMQKLMAADTTLKRVTLTDNNGVIIADTNVEQIGIKYGTKEKNSGRAGENINKIIKWAADVRTKSKNEVLGKVEVEYDNGEIISEIRSNLDKVAVKIGMITGIALFIGMLVGLILAEGIARPIINLTKKAKEVRSGNLGIEMEAKGRDETSQLIHVIKDMVAKLKALDELKDDFVNNVSHEIKSPIASILSYDERLLSEQDGELNVTQVSHLNLIRKAGERLSGFINNILDLAKIKSGKFDLDFKKSNLFDITQDVVNMNRMICIERKVECVISGSREGVGLECDEDHIKRVIINLVGNALKFTPENGKIEIKIWPEGSKVRCEVKNPGKGIKPEDLKKLFNRFEQSESLEHHKERRKGTGLGLAISKDIVEMHKGQIFAQSEYGVSASFIFLLPKIQLR